MEAIVTSLKTSQRLEDAGFAPRLEAALAWFPGGEGVSPYVAPYTGDDNCVRAWTAQEIAERLPVESEVCKAADGYDARRWTTGDNLNSYIHSDTMAESLAALWLSLNEPAA